MNLFNFYLFYFLFLVVFYNRHYIYIVQVLNDGTTLMFLLLGK